MSSCPHLSEFKSKLGPNWFRVLAHCLRVKPLGRASILYNPGELPHCVVCRPHPCPSPSGLYACLSCASVFCCPHAGSDLNPCHVIGVDVDRAELFCFICLDQIYDRDFDTTVILAQKAIASSSLLQHPSLPQTDNSHLHKRRRIDYVPWSADPLEKSLTQNKSCPLNNNVGNNTLNGNVAGNNNDNGNVVEPSLPLGLRGLNNLGNTCFMNSVLQALLHTPPLRNYFLSDRHNRYFCKQKKKSNSTLESGDGGRNLSSGQGGRGGGRESNSKVNHLCLACDLDEIFSAIFKEDRTPFSPSSFLYSWWQHAANLASYEQQDAHEFFISMLAGIHEKVERDLRKPQSQGNGDCCIAHRVFSGILRSDVMCMACGFTSTTYDPCVDISLDLEPNKGNSSRTTLAGTKSYSGLANGANPSQNRGISTLLGCLDRFTRPERLGSDQKFFCQQCQVKQESLKQMSIRKLPLVSCFHIKRFEHSSIRKMSKKVDHYLQFPFSLNMAPYLSSSILRSRYGNRMFTFDGDDPESPKEPSSEFELFAVVTHSGRLDAGHYITYLRLSNHWYKCDDAWITEVSETIVRAAQGYMMFYVQKMLYYKARRAAIHRS